MNIRFCRKEIGEEEVDTIISLIPESLPEAFKSIDPALKKKIEEISRDLPLYTKDSFVLLTPEGVKAKRVLLLKVPPSLDPLELRKVYSQAGREARLKELGPDVAITLTGLVDPLVEIEIAIEGIAQGSYLPNLYRTEKRERDLENLILCHPPTFEAQKVAGKAELVANTQTYVRNLVNEPASVVTPLYLVEEAKRIAAETGSEIEVLSVEQAEKMGMGAFVAVARGSDQPAFMVKLHHPGKGGKNRLTLVGKGLTFDSGGLSLKPWESMITMKSDMAGAAAVLGAFRVLPLLRPELDLMGFLALTENLPSGKAYKPGDVIKAMNGKTIEILSTDAEGRLVLADALAWAVKEGAKHIVDVATLTGACIIALGHETSGLFSNHPSWTEKILQAAKKAGERVWELPMFPEYKELIRSEIADLANSAGRSGAPAGAIFGAMFLKEFVPEGIAWAHLDIAGPSWLPKNNKSISGGATGASLRTLIELGLDF
ncbi:MAG: leucyl aminopeptidase [Caldiserica bacterium]|jgi:leucyl aminopeptidase|nr:leucyl aminopeptidase [Caldisericota bacterium]MDH7562442.1 leucyl aminopeptidase [Caldisericota bacterium]